MICTDLVYLRPGTPEEAVSAWLDHAGRGKPGDVRYLAGGTEIVTGARRLAAVPRVLIDLKSLAETRAIACDAAGLYLGAALSLNEAADPAAFPLLSAAVRNVADRSVRNRLSLGGNVAGALPYREAVLPLLLADATVESVVPGTGPGAAPSRRVRALSEAFDKRLSLEPGELVLGFRIPALAASLPWAHFRRTRTGPVDYPLVTACFMPAPRPEGGGGNPPLRVAFTGLHPYPVLFQSAESAEAALRAPGTVRKDQRASAEYRLALALDMLKRGKEALS